MEIKFKVKAHSRKWHPLDKVDLSGLSYDKNTGIISRTKKKSGCSIGPVMTTSPRGYRTIKINGIQYRQHRLCPLFIGINPDGYEIDHINGDPSDNRIKNLRIVDRSTNCLNTSIHRRGKYPYISFHKSGKKWRVIKEVNGKQLEFGRFSLEKDAIQCVIDNKLWRNNGNKINRI